jgi:hypothetical protein
MRLLDPIARATLHVMTVLDQPARDPMRRRRDDEGGRPPGVALLLALITIAILATATVEFAYSTRVNLTMSVNTADKLRSHYLAKSAVNITRLLLQFQYALKDESRESGRGGDDFAQLISRAMRRSNFQMYQYVDLLMKPFNSGRLESPVGGIDLKSSGVEGFGEFHGTFSAVVEPEEGKVDLNKFARKEIKESDIIELCAMVSDPHYDSIFEQKDSNGETLTRGVVLGRIVDYIDTNENALELTPECLIRSQSGDETRPYSRLEKDIEPRNGKITHVEELYLIPGVTDAFMKAFGSKMTVYPVGRPNINSAEAPIFYSVLCRNVRVQGSRPDESSPLNLCARNAQVRQQVMLLSLALDGIRQFFSNPMSVLMAYVGTSESTLMPSGRKGQPVAFLSVSQLPDYIRDFKNDPQLVAQFIVYSPLYQQIVRQNPNFAIDPANPQLPQWTVSFNRTGLMRSVSSRTPQIYKIKAKGEYGSSESEIDAVLDFGKTIRRMPDEKKLTENDSDPEEVKKIKEALNKRRQTMPRGRVLYWREK